jgi:hypothetical protein
MCIVHVRAQACTSQEAGTGHRWREDASEKFPPIAPHGSSMRYRLPRQPFTRSCTQGDHREPPLFLAHCHGHVLRRSHLRSDRRAACAPQTTQRAEDIADVVDLVVRERCRDSWVAYIGSQVLACHYQGFPVFKSRMLRLSAPLYSAEIQEDLDD